MGGKPGGKPPAAAAARLASSVIFDKLDIVFRKEFGSAGKKREEKREYEIKKAVINMAGWERVVKESRWVVTIFRHSAEHPKTTKSPKKWYCLFIIM